MTKLRTVLIAAALATLLSFSILAPFVRADIFRWEYINPAVPSQGKQQSTILAPDGAGANAVPGADLSLRNLTTAYLIGADVTGSNWTAADLTNAELRQANLTSAYFGGYYETTVSDYIYHLGANLTDSNLGQANLTGANFYSATLTNANLSLANLTHAGFIGATLSGATLTGADVRGTNFARTFLPYPIYTWAGGITLTQLYSTASYQAGDLTGLGLQLNELPGGNFNGQNLTNAGFGGATLTNADFTSANLTNADFYSAQMTGATLVGAEVRGARFSHAINAAQLYSTASYQAHDLTGVTLGGNFSSANFVGQNLTNGRFHGITLTNANLSQANLTNANFSAFDNSDPNFPNLYPTADLSGANLSQANLTNANFSGGHSDYYDTDYPGAILTNANLSGADARGANFQYATLTGTNTSNLIQSDGHIAGLDLIAGASLAVRDYDGNPTIDPAGPPISIHIDEQFAMSSGGTLQTFFDADPWDSTISFAAGILVTRGGTLELTFAPEVNLSSQIGRTFDVFDWTGVNPSGAFTVASPYTWDLSQLYTTGDVTLTSVPEPGTIVLAALGLVGLIGWRRFHSN